MQNNNRKPVVGITQGDGNGIGYEVIIKALADARILESFTPVIYGSSKLFGFYRKTIHNLDQIDTNIVASAADAHQRRVNIVNCLPDNVYVEPGQPNPEAAKAAITCLERAVEDLKGGNIDVLVTAPFNKKVISSQGFGFTGHTEYLQNAFGVKDVTMFMVSDRIKVGVVTGHIPLREVPDSITEDKILSKLRLMDASLRRDFGVDSPRIGVLSLNPHSGDGGLLGDEEERIIAPAVAKAVSEGIEAFGPYSPDGYFGAGLYTRFDATLAMYHDQGLEPFKAIAFEDGVNFTAGLPIVRTSPDHGTAYDMAGRDEADPRSMMSAIYTAIDIFRKREAYDALQEGKMPERVLDDAARPQRPGRPQIA
ncbi:MAG: 4-hydroxythreonine-4-phosphate dehydrogenase PdxA [Bacteroidales bacterium]|jgi:4-hydroxythreonine-4-phosphate dehydrogenase|nr:4-hydroxythreonine-4-phosphate dehydrogenase PdxA [Bacteroidales bacterium]MBR4228452.1 4-hydroxythreonine-4-phosphate dehydrogenase PdxA [Bacteroidales bacterium]